MQDVDKPEDPQAVILRVKSMIQSITGALSVDMAEEQTLHAAGYLTWAQSAGLIGKELYDELTQTVGDALREWLPQSPS